jgi:hypothetical protein
MTVAQCRSDPTHALQAIVPLYHLNRGIRQLRQPHELATGRLLQIGVGVEHELAYLAVFERGARLLESCDAEAARTHGSDEEIGGGLAVLGFSGGEHLFHVVRHTVKWGPNIQPQHVLDQSRHTGRERIA